ncbi:DUF159 family protein [Geobacter sp. SVR]|nr:DUF159 family protein [Geobacter sp. SVR]
MGPDGRVRKEREVCGRFTSFVSPETLADRFGVPLPEPVPPRYNIAPTQQVRVVRNGDGGRQLADVRWGRLPSWPNDLDIDSEAVSTRAEALPALAADRDFPRAPCLVPASGFFAWKHAGGTCQPWYVTRKDGAPIGLAGVIGDWTTPGGTCIETCTIVTTGAGDLVRQLCERMPAIIAPDRFDEWLAAPLPLPSAMLPLLNHLPAGQLWSYPVNPVVNRPAHDAADCIEPAHRT